MRIPMVPWVLLVASAVAAACSSPSNGSGSTDAAAASDDASAVDVGVDVDASGASDAAAVGDVPSEDAATDGASDVAPMDAGDADDASDATDAPDVNVPTYAVAGTITGLLGSGLVLQDNAGDDLPVAADGSFTFATKIADGGSYKVTVKTPPSSPSQACTIKNGVGKVAGADVTNVTITCSTNDYYVAGNVSGLVGGGVFYLQNNGGDDVEIDGNGPFFFQTPIASNGGYEVTIKSQPTSPPHECTVTNGKGTIGASNVTGVQVDCIRKWTIGGKVTGLSPVGTGVVLQNNLGDDITVSETGTFVFPTPLLDGSDYSVTVLTSPTGPARTCTVASGGSGKATSVVGDVVVSCGLPGLIGYWAFEEGSGTVAKDSSGNGFDGTHNATYVAGKLGQALYFASGGRHGVTIYGNDAFTWGANNADYTVEYWLNVWIPNSGVIFHKSDPQNGNCCSGTQRTPMQQFRDDGSAQFLAIMGTANSPNHFPGTIMYPTYVGISLNTWVHVAIVHSATKQLIYMNGSLALSDTLGSQTVGGPGILSLGWDGANLSFLGSMDEAKVYGRALSAAEIQQEMQTQ